MNGPVIRYPLDAFAMMRCEALASKLNHDLRLEHNNPEKEHNKAALAKSMNTFFHIWSRLEVSMYFSSSNKRVIPSLVKRASVCHTMMLEPLDLHNVTLGP